MNRRKLLQGMAVAAMASLAPAVALSRTVDVARPVPSPGSSPGFKKILMVECTVIDMINDSFRKIGIENSDPVEITEGRKPFAISVKEDDENFLSVAILRKTRDGYVTEQTIGAGKNGVQVLRSRGVVLQFRTFDS